MPLIWPRCKDLSWIHLGRQFFCVSKLLIKDAALGCKLLFGLELGKELGQER